jgi:nucleotide-binding universal stress UspA family protein
MSFISKVLFPVDFSSACIHMAGYVKQAANMFDAEVSLLHVVELESHNGFELYMRSPREIAEDHRSAARSELEVFLIREFPMADYPRLLSSGDAAISGDAAMEIIRIGRVGGFDLIMMPTHSGFMKQIFLGSTTAKVINDSNIPVLTTRHADAMALRPLESVGTSGHVPSANARRTEVDAKVLVGTNV